MKNFKFDHINITVGADDKALNFFRDVLGFENGYRPPFPFAGEWLYAKEQAVIHAITPDNNERVKLGHIAFRSDERADKIVKRIEKLEFNYRLTVIPESGETQIFVDLDGLTIEIDTPFGTAEKTEVE